MADSPETAFALAGLGGFNAHGAGFLTAARECKVVPQLITATSGQIVVLADWLQDKDLKKALVNPELEHNSVAQLQVALYGDPGVFKPAYAEAVARWWQLPQFGRPVLEFFADRVAPAEIYVPTRTPADYETIARVFNATESFGIVFNAYNFKTGEPVLYGSAKAHQYWPQNKHIQQASQAKGIRKRSSGEVELKLQPITAKAVQSALWLSLYGFDNLPQADLIDGAYLRACIVSELHLFDRIFVARPLSEGWLGRGPRNWFEVQDWQTEMWFSAGYKAEVDTLLQINGLIKDGHLTGKFKHVDLIEIAPSRPAGFFNYFIERERVFSDAYKLAKDKFAAHGLAARDTWLQARPGVREVALVFAQAGIPTGCLIYGFRSPRS